MTGPAGRSAGVGGPSVRLRPQRLRVLCGVLAALVLAVCLVAAAGLGGRTGSGYGRYLPGDRPAMVVLGVLAALGVLSLTRPRVSADADTVRVRNLVGGYELPWTAVRRVRFDAGALCASLELLDDEVVSVHALQSVDRGYAVAGVRALRSLHAAAVAGTTGPASD